MERVLDTLESIAIDCGHRIFDELGPGLLRPVYEAVLANQLEQKDLIVERQKSVAIAFDDQEFDEGFHCALLIENKLLIQVKSAEQILPVHGQEVETYLRLMKLPLGLIMNFGSQSYKRGVRRIVNSHLT